jgi:hypothetical protein
MNNLRKACLELRKWKRDEDFSAGPPSKIARASAAEPSYMSTDTTNPPLPFSSKASKEQEQQEHPHQQAAAANGGGGQTLLSSANIKLIQ